MAMAQASQGIPRTINILCDTALVYRVCLVYRYLLN